MVLVFRTNKGNYLVADDQIPGQHLPFQDEGLEYVCTLRHTMYRITKEPEKTYEVGNGWGKYEVSLTHLSAGQLQSAVGTYLRDVNVDIKRIENDYERLPQLNTEGQFLMQLHSSLNGSD